jgi:hypothetical protein
MGRYLGLLSLPCRRAAQARAASIEVAERLLLGDREHALDLGAEARLAADRVERAAREADGVARAVEALTEAARRSSLAANWQLRSFASRGSQLARSLSFSPVWTRAIELI